MGWLFQQFDICPERAFHLPPTFEQMERPYRASNRLKKQTQHGALNSDTHARGSWNHHHLPSDYAQTR